MTETQVFSLIRELKHHWYEIFHHLGFSHEQLAQCKKKHPLDSELCLMEMITQWIKDSPSWKSLVAVLRYQLLENEIANKVEKIHCIQEGSTTIADGQFLHTFFFSQYVIIMKNLPHPQ